MSNISNDIIEQSSLLATTKGLILPLINDIQDDIDNNDYNLALLNVISEYDGIYTLMQKLRLEKYKSLHFTGNWNPFLLENPNTCIPYDVKSIINYGYDRFTDNCKCPDNTLPCTQELAIQDIENWTNKLQLHSTHQNLHIFLKNLKIMTKHLKIINGKGDIIKTIKMNENISKKEQFCKSTDVILCSTLNYEVSITQWYDYKQNQIMK